MTALALELRMHAPDTAPEGEGATSRTDPCDEALAQRVQLGGNDASAAFGILVERYEGRLVGFLVRRTGSRHDAEDMAQEAFLRAWSRIATYDSSRRFSVWLFTVAARVATSEWRRRKRPDISPLRIETACAEITFPDPDVWSIAERVLDPETMSAVWLRYAAGLEPSEVARVLGRTSVGVRVMLHRARKKIASELHGWTPGDQQPTMAQPESEREP
ncbi:MAG: sigma-70 family RNA polymerase sigma factor [Phycisphaerae bacterium]|nr:sigma-70 family RNA polymerase sigma factor [Phycisphaerae bacterium]